MKSSARTRCVDDVQGVPALSVCAARRSCSEKHVCTLFQTLQQDKSHVFRVANKRTHQRLLNTPGTKQAPHRKWWVVVRDGVAVDAQRLREEAEAVITAMPQSTKIVQGWPTRVTTR